MPKQYELGTIPFLRIEMMDAEYEFLPELFLRTPYYSFARYDMERLSEIIDDQVFRNAIWLASPGFYRQLERKDFDFNGLLAKEKNTLYKYYNRMCFRPTPFGSFASFTNLKWGSGATVHLENDEQVFLHLHPDQGLIARLNADVKDDGDNVLLTRNPTLYRFGNEFRFIKSIPDPKGKYHFTVNALKAEPFYQKVISLFNKDGYFPMGRLRESIQHLLSGTTDEAEEYVIYLVTEQILFKPETGKIIYPGEKKEIGAHTLGLEAWWEKARQNPVKSVGLLSKLSDTIKLHLTDGADASEQLFYAALERPYQSGGPGLDDQEDIKLGIRALQLLSVPGKSTTLKQFITQFSAKFDLEKVPLLRALDPDTGINYSNLMAGSENNELLNDIRFPAEESLLTTHEWTTLHRALFKIWMSSDRDYYTPLNLKESELAELDKTDHNSNSPTITVMYRKTENGLVIEHAGGITATALIGRFSIFSTQTHELSQRIANEEALSNAGVVFADIAQLTDQHVDNINRRKQIYPYEIPINVYSSLAYEAQIRPEDLYLSVRGGELILESKRLNKRVIPRLATMYNYHLNALAIFRLLGDLQYQGLKSSLSLDLEQFFPDLDFYPRVCIGHVILCCAKWKFSMSQLATLQEGHEPDPFRQVREFRTRYQLPQRISIGHGDQQLVFDLGNRDEAGFFLTCISGLKQVMIQEYFLADRTVKVGSRPMAGQYVAFMKHGQRVFAMPANSNFNDHRQATRDFPLGSEWVYLKIYCTPESADQILVNTLRPFLIKNQKQLKKWFFIRYNEHGYHLRVRLNTEGGHLGTLLTGLRKQLDATGQKRLIKELQGDTYRRELERYGTDMMMPVEQYFEASSNFVLKMLHERGKEEFYLTEFEAGFFTAFNLINCFLAEQVDTRIFTGNMAESFLSGYKTDKTLRKDMDSKYREIKGGLTDLVERPLAQTLTRELEKAFKNLVDQTKIIAKAMIAKTDEEKSKLIADLIHMHLNRNFKSNQRQQELLIYYCLHKYIGSKIARSGR